MCRIHHSRRKKTATRIYNLFVDQKATSLVNLGAYSIICAATVYSVYRVFSRLVVKTLMLMFCGVVRTSISDGNTFAEVTQRVKDNQFRKNLFDNAYEVCGCCSSMVSFHS